ncbi:9620_t:CDS:1, partial [Dentiscutata heterogama]
QVKLTFDVISGKRETPISGTPIGFMNLYCDAWNGDPNLRPSISEIRQRLNNILKMEPVYYNSQNINVDILSNKNIDSTQIEFSGIGNNNISIQCSNSIGLLYFI